MSVYYHTDKLLSDDLKLLQQTYTTLLREYLQDAAEIDVDVTFEVSLRQPQKRTRMVSLLGHFDFVRSPIFVKMIQPLRSLIKELLERAPNKLWAKNPKTIWKIFHDVSSQMNGQLIDRGILDLKKRNGKYYISIKPHAAMLSQVLRQKGLERSAA